MGMDVRIDVRGPGASETAVEDALAWLRWVDATFSPYRPSSEISRIGRGELAPGDAHPLVRQVLGRCERLRRRTRGAFDARATGRLDPSGLVKGWATERAGSLLAAAGAARFCVDAGGDVLVRGGRAPGEPWRVGVRHPRAPGRFAAVLELTDGAVATSGTYERGPHLVDPRTGRPPVGVQSVTVAGPDLGEADALTTAVFAMGAAGPSWTARHPGLAAMTVLQGDRVLATPAFLRMCAGGSPAASLAREDPAGPHSRLTLSSSSG
jgi:thiamine biosynthesis lipoprotein